MNNWTRVGLHGNSGTWVLKPDQNHRNGRLFKGSIIVRGGVYALEHALRELGAADNETEPKYKRLVPYRLWIEMITHGTSRWAWIKEERWNKFLEKYGPMPSFAEEQNQSAPEGVEDGEEV